VEENFMRRTISTVHIAIAIVMVLSASVILGNRALAASPHRAAFAGGSVNFSVWGSNPTETTAQHELITNFQNKYKIHVNFETLNGDYNVQLKARITAGTAPDVMYINSDHIRDYETTGALKNLSFLKNVKGLGFPSAFYSNLQAGYNYKGAPYAVVKDVSPLALWYNKDMFTAAGIKSPPTTWAQLKTDACKLTDKAKKVSGLSLSADPARWLAFLQEAGGSLLNKAQTKATVNSSAARTALAFYAGLVRSGCAARPDQLGAGWNGEAFGKGVAAMAIEGNWLTSAMQVTYPSIHYGVAALPKGPKGYSNLAFTAGYAMFARTKNLKNAQTLLEYLISKPGETVWTHVALYVPPRKDVKLIPGTAIFQKSIKGSQDWFFPAGFADRGLSPIGIDIQKAQDGQLSDSAAVADMQQKATAALSSAP
jgi:multiple sugar transport system substrate-binding protein